MLPFLGVIRQQQKLEQRIADSTRDWRSLNQTKSQNSLKTLNCLRLARRSVRIADVALIGCHQATTLKQQN